MRRACALVPVAANAALASSANADVPLPGTQPEDFQDPALGYAPLGGLPDQTISCRLALGAHPS